MKNHQLRHEVLTAVSIRLLSLGCDVVYVLQYSGSQYFAAMTYMTRFDGNTKISVTIK